MELLRCAAEDVLATELCRRWLCGDEYLQCEGVKRNGEQGEFAMQLEIRIRLVVMQQGSRDYNLALFGLSFTCRYLCLA